MRIGSVRNSCGRLKGLVAEHRLYPEKTSLTGLDWRDIETVAKAVALHYENTDEAPGPHIHCPKCEEPVYSARLRPETGLREILQLMQPHIEFLEMHCPCGARPESPSTHGHVMSCPVAHLTELLKQGLEAEREG